MKKVTLSLRMRKVRAGELSLALNHNGRKIEDKDSPHFTKRSDIKRLHLNSSRVHTKYMQIKNTEDLVVLLKNEMKESKKKGICPKKSRFPRLKTHRKNKDQSVKIIDTALVREFIIQIGNAKDEVNLPDDIYLKIVYFLLKKLQNDGMKIDIHRDESSVHVHVLTNYWSSKLGQFNNTLRKPDSLHELQIKVNSYAKKILEPLGYEVVPIVPKSKSKHKHIPLALYERYATPLDELLAIKRQEIEALEHDKQMKEKLICDVLKDVLLNLKKEMQLELKEAIFPDQVEKNYRILANVAYAAAGKMLIDLFKEDDSKEIQKGEDYVTTKVS